MLLRLHVTGPSKMRYNDWLHLRITLDDLLNIISGFGILT
jgi:hypothetical protein